MADVDTLMLSQEHSDIRRDAATHANEIIKEGLKESFNNIVATKDARHDILDTTGDGFDRLVSQVDKQYHAGENRQWELMREVIDAKATIRETQNNLSNKIDSAAIASARDSEIAALRSQLENQKNTQFLADKIGSEGIETRRLVNDLHNGDLNRMLIERTAELSDERQHARSWRGHFDNSQYAALSNQLQAFQSQLTETRQGMVNFGTMAGVGQTSTSNNVR